MENTMENTMEINQLITKGLEYYGVQYRFPVRLLFDSNSVLVGVIAPPSVEHDGVSCGNHRIVYAPNGDVLLEKNLGAWTNPKRSFIMHDFSDAVEKVAPHKYTLDVGLGAAESLIQAIIDGFELPDWLHFWYFHPKTQQRMLTEINSNLRGTNFSFNWDMNQNEFLNLLPNKLHPTGIVLE